MTNFDNRDFNDDTLASKIKKNIELKQWNTVKFKVNVHLNAMYYKRCAYLMYAYSITIHLIIQ